MRTIHVKINGMFVQKDSKNGGVQGEGNATQLHITLDNTWAGYGKRIIWRDAKGQNPVSLVLFDANGGGQADTLVYETPVPAEALALPGWCSFTLEGYQAADEAAQTPASAAFSVRDFLQVEENDSVCSPAEPTPDFAQQVLAVMGRVEDGMKTYAQDAADSAEKAGEAAASANECAAATAEAAAAASGSAKAAEGSAAAAAGDAEAAQRAARLSESWAAGGTGAREGEDTNNAKYWSDRAQAIVGTDYVVRTGDTMTGPLYLAGDPETPMEPVTKRYAERVLVSSAEIKRYNLGG
ncbi:hypothetical protein [Dysosmobacter sp.]|uniref:hypothetical protein n=1 Tax=Dysosmobacter sp. TaxID=2591382 RepID=UPI002A94EEF4|nr:hypothetical protein [Dysosmobacter sp.]MDY5510006.1 hypothetical protein [Dysosmobacter sp.]